jgi:hypothetical protein
LCQLAEREPAIVVLRVSMRHNRCNPNQVYELFVIRRNGHIFVQIENHAPVFARKRSDSEGV